MMHRSHAAPAAAMILSLCLLLALSACGGEGAVTGPGAALNHYSAVHDGVPYAISVDAACFSGGAFYYISAKQSESGGLLSHQLYSFSPETGAGGWMEAFRLALRAWEQAAGQNVNGITALTGGAEGTLYLAAHSLPAGAEPDTPQTLWILAYAPGAEELRWAAQLPADFDDGYVRQLAADGAGNLFGLELRGRLFALDCGGVLLFSTETEGDHLATLADGRAAVLRALPGSSGWEVRLPDPASGRESTAGTLPWLYDGTAADAAFFPGQGEDDLYLATGTSLFALKLGAGGGEGTGEALLSWANCDVDGTGLLALTWTEERGFAALAFGAALGAECARLTWHETDPGAEKTTLTLACRTLPATVSRMILKFNRQSETARILVQDYGPAVPGGVDRLTLDLNAGRVPDLFCTQGLDMQPLMDRGLLENLWPWIDGDDVLSRESLVLPLFSAMETDGALYSVTDSFFLRTALALPGVAGDAPGWSLEAFWAAQGAMADCRSLSGQSRDQVLEDVLELYVQGFVDWEAGTARFDSPDFLALLDYLAAFPEERSREDDRDFWLAEGKQLFAPGSHDYGSILYARMDQVRLCGSVGTTVCKGYPGLPGSGSAFVPRTPLAMSSACGDKETGWAFLRALLLPENQSYFVSRGGGEQGFPTNRQVFSAMLRDCEEDAVPLTFEGVYGAVELPRWTAADSADFTRWLESITLTVHPEPALKSILRDEIGRFLSGQQSGESAAQAIQRRVQLCLDERK